MSLLRFVPRWLMPWTSAATAEVLTLSGLPGGSLVSMLFGKLNQERWKEAHKILLKEISEGKHGKVTFVDADVDPIVDIMHRFKKAVEDGTARTNLKFLAQVIAGQKSINGRLDPDQFRRWSAILEDLTEEELLLLGTFHVLAKEYPDDRDIWLKVEQRLHEDFNITKETAEACAAAVCRTGLLTSTSAWSGMSYSPTVWLAELAELTDLVDLGAEVLARTS